MAAAKGRKGADAKERASEVKSNADGSAANGARYKKIQQVLLECWKLESKIQDIPVQIEAKRNSLKNKKSQYLNWIEQGKRLADFMKDDKARLDDVIKRREDAEGKLEHVSSQREFDVENAIAENSRKEEHRVRVHISNLEKKSELVRERIAQLDKDIADIESRQAEEISALEKDLEDAKVEYAKVLEKKEKESEKIDPNLIYKFDRIIRNKGGLATASLKSGICQGCHMQLPDQFVNIVREDVETQFCPYCSRILVYEEGKDDEEIIESNIKYNDRRQSEEDERELSEAMSADEIPEPDIDDIEADADDSSDDADDDLDDIAKETLGENSLIADESEFDL